MNGLERAVERSARPLRGGSADYDDLLEAIDDARVVLIGEASHGTHEFYRERARITKRLITEREFIGVAAEADWPDAWRANLWIRGRNGDRTASEALGGFQRFPTWMWRNADVLDFLGWLRGWNEHAATQCGFYGLDLYSLNTSIEAVVRYLDEVDPAAAREARHRYSCFDHAGPDAATYARMGGCEDDVVAQLVEMLERDGTARDEDLFSAQQNARLVSNAESYYRSMLRTRVESWNLRDMHMADTLDALLDYLGEGSKVVVWAHNSHVGDASATGLGAMGETNIGQLARERHGRNAYNVGLTTYTGTVTAASTWDGPAERKRVRPALAGSFEALFHSTGIPRFLLFPGMLSEPRLERAIGVIYRPETERQSHWFHARMSTQFDAVIHFDESRALEPLEAASRWRRGELPETYPHAV